jgi:uncharacterized protein (TIRG00374 family)
MKRIRDALWMLLRLGLAVAVLTWLVRKMGIEQMTQTLRATAGNWPWLLAAIVVMLAPMILCMLRWKIILDAQDMPLPLARVNAIFFIGLFFNSFMIGPTGGDVVKAYYTARETHHKKTEAVTSIFIDRVVGMMAMALMVVVMILLRWGFYMAHTETRAPALALLTFCGTFLIGGVLVFSVHLFEAIPLLKRCTQHPVVGKPFLMLERVYNAFYVCRARPRLLLKILGLSLVLQTLLVVVAALVGQALDIHVSFIDYLSFVPLVAMIGAIPITPGGVGIREFASQHAWSVLGIPAAKAVLLSFLPYVAMVLWGLPGGIVFLFHRAGAGHSMKEEMQAAEREE